MFPCVGGAKEIKLTYYVSHKAQNFPPEANSCLLRGIFISITSA